MLSFAIDLVPLARLHMRPLQEELQSQWVQTTGSFDDEVAVTPRMKEAFELWSQKSHLSQGLSFLPVIPDYIVTTDASMEGWGGHLQDLQVQGKWFSAQRQLHINRLELKAIFLSLQAFLPRIQGSSVLIRTGNTTSMLYINKQGGTKSLSLSQDA